MTTHLSVLPNWLGDLVMASPALSCFGAGVRHVVVGAPALVELVLDLGLADEGVVVDRRGADRGWRRWPDVVRRLRAINADRALVLGPSLRAAVLAVASGAPERRGVGGEARELLLTHVHRVVGGLKSQHLSTTWWEVAEGHGFTPRPRWRPGDRGRHGWSALQSEQPALQAPFAAFAAGATFGPTKRWPAARFAELARAVAERTGWTPVFVGGDAPRERVVAEELAHATNGVSIAGRTDLPTLVAALEAAQLFVGNDSGPMHVAAAAGTPTVGVFGSTSPAWTAPRGEQAAVAGPAPVPCSPCFRRTCPFDLECLRDLTASEVLAVVENLIGDVMRPIGPGPREDGP